MALFITLFWHFFAGGCVSWFDTQSFDPLNSLLRKVLLSSSHFTDEQTKSQRHPAPSSESKLLTVHSAEETATQHSIEGLSAVPGTRRLRAWWLFSWEALKGPERQPRGFLQVDAFLTDLLWGGGTELGYLTVAFQPLGGLGSGPGQQACRGLEGWAAGSSLST